MRRSNRGRRLRPDIAAADHASGGGEFVYHSIDLGTGVHTMNTDDAVAAGMSSGGQPRSSSTPCPAAADSSASDRFKPQRLPTARSFRGAPFERHHFTTASTR
jgi:hypothetical protein